MPNLNVTEFSERSPHMSTNLAAGRSRTTKNEPDCADVLADLYGLLEDYAPQWYTEQLHERTARVLRTVGRL